MLSNFIHRLSGNRPGSGETLTQIGEAYIEMNNFYTAINRSPNTSMAESLRQSQMLSIDSDYQHPYYWSSFILIAF